MRWRSVSGAKGQFCLLRCVATAQCVHSVQIQDVLVLGVPNLFESLPMESSNTENQRRTAASDAGKQMSTIPLALQLSCVQDVAKTYENLIGDEYCILGDIVRHPRQAPVTRAYVRAGPRKTLYFNPRRVKAAIVTCGGLCPGLNNVIRELVRSLFNLYGVAKVYGIRYVLSDSAAAMIREGQAGDAASTVWTGCS